MTKEQAEQIIRDALSQMRLTLKEHQTLLLALSVLLGEQK